MELLSIKGNTDNVELSFTKDVSLKEVETALNQLRENRFFTYSNLKISYSGITFSYDEEMQFEKSIKTVFGKQSVLIKKQKLSRKQINYSLGADESVLKIVNRSLRSGDEVRFSGDVIVYGDVNPGAHVYAGGNITVIGALRGCASVKKGGKVYATYMAPMQIRIGKLCSYNKRSESVGPAIALSENDEIILQCL